ncbi:MAG TPA: hypothetical protein VF941_14965 [Clostridia bacterium]
MNSEFFKENIPSIHTELLNKLKGQKLIKMTRYSWWQASEAVEQCSISAEEVFSLTAGPILLYFESGIVLGGASNPSENSVIIWAEKDGDTYTSEEAIENDPELWGIDAVDEKYSSDFWRKVIGKHIVDFSIIKREPQNAKYIDLPNEVGLMLVTEDNEKFILSHGLHDNSDDFSVITESQIDEGIVSKLQGLKMA